MMSIILNSAIFYSAILNQKKIHSFILTQLDDGSHLEFYHLGFSYFAQKHFTHTFWLNLMMAAILNSTILDSATVILDSDTLLSSFRFTQKHSHSSLTLTQTNSIWLKLIHSYLTWWCQPSWNLPSWIQPFWTKITSLIHCHSNLWWQPSWILPSWIQQFCTKLWLKLIHSHSTWWYQPSCILPSWIQLFWTKKKLHSFILTQIYDGSHLEFYHLGFSYFAQKNFTHTFWLNLMMAAILKCAILDSAILHKTLTQTHSFLLNLRMSAILNSTILDSAILHRRNFTHSFWLNLMMAAILNSAMVDSDTAIFNSDTLLFLSDSLKNTLTPLWLWLKLIQSYSNSFILT